MPEHLLGRGLARACVTFGCICWGEGLPEHGLDVVAVDEAVAVDDEAEPEAEDDDVMPNVATKMWRGWRLSYRSIEPENTPTPQFLASLVAI